MDKNSNKSTKINNKTMQPPSPFLFNIGLEVLAITIRQLKEVMGKHIGKEEVKMSLFSEYIVKYISDIFFKVQ